MRRPLWRTALFGTAGLAAAVVCVFPAAAAPVWQTKLPYLGCLENHSQYVARVRPAGCVIQRASDYKRFQISPPEAVTRILARLRWSVWTTASATGTGADVPIVDANFNTKVVVTLSAPKVGCPPFHEGVPGMKTFTRITMREGSRVETWALPVQPCLPPGA